MKLPITTNLNFGHVLDHAKQLGPIPLQSGHSIKRVLQDVEQEMKGNTRLWGDCFTELNTSTLSFLLVG